MPATRARLACCAFTLLLLTSGMPTQAQDGRWSESTRTLFGAETRLRVLRSVPSALEREAMPHLVAIVWRYADTGDPRQMPEPLEAVRIIELDTLLGKHIEAAGLGRLTVTMTGALQHEWLFYTADPKRLLLGFNALAGASERWPVRLLTQPDPGWQTYLSLLRRELAVR